MIFRTFDGELIELNKCDFTSVDDYNYQLMEIYGINKNSKTLEANNFVNQVDYIYDKIMRQK